MRRWRKSLLIAGVVIVAVPMMLIADVGIVAWHARWMASRMLACVQQLHPGRTTLAEAEAVLKPFEKYDQHYDASPNVDGESSRNLAIANYPDWLTAIAIHIPWREDLLPLPYTSFSIEPSFRQGTLSEIHTHLMQENPGSIHPFATSVDDRAQEFEGIDDDFHGYASSSIGTGEYDVNGKLVREWPIVYQKVRLDQRATFEERRRAYAFQFHCFTSLARCNSGTKISQPAPNR